MDFTPSNKIVPLTTIRPHGVAQACVMLLAILSLLLGLAMAGTGAWIVFSQG